MSFFSRLRQGISYAISGKTVAALVPSWESLRPEWAIGAKFDVLVKEGYRKNELIFACLNATAAAASMIKLQLIRKSDNQIVEDHPLLDLIHRPNDSMNESDFWASVVLFQKLAGRGIYEIEYSNRDEPIALWPLRPDRIQVVQAEKRPVIKNYIYKVSGVDDQVLSPDEILDFPLFDPLDRFKAYPPVAVAARTGDVDNSATDYIKMIWDNGGMPQVYLKTTQVMTSDNITDTRRRWRERYGGFKNWLEPAILDRDQDVQKLSWSFQELGFEFLDARNEVRICLVLDVPAILIGAKAGIDASTYSNYELADRSWWRNDLLPMFNNLMDVIEYRLLPKFDPNDELMARWDISAVVALQENVDNIWKRATEGLKIGGLTRNEFYEQIGLPPRGAAGEVYLLPFSVIEAPAKLPAKSLSDNGREGKAVDDMPDDDDERRKHERLYKKELMTYFDDQMTRIVKDAQTNRR